MSLFLVGVTGFEPTTSWSRTKRATKLRYTPEYENIQFQFTARENMNHFLVLRLQSGWARTETVPGVYDFHWLDEIVENPPECNLVYTLRSFQPYADDFLEEKFHFIGPSVYDRKEEDFPFLPKPVICISLGTILKGAEKFFCACMNAFQNENVTVVMSVGKNFNIAKLGKLPENFIVKDQIPQVAVLKQARAFITHGGMNSVSEAMVHGVPMVVIPFVSDQPVNARQVEKMGLGKVLNYKAVTADKLKEAATAVMEDTQIRENLKKIQNEIAQAPGNIGAVDIIEAYYGKY